MPWCLQAVISIAVTMIAAEMFLLSSNLGVDQDHEKEHPVSGELSF
jgi:hypothetical protein